MHQDMRVTSLVEYFPLYLKDDNEPSNLQW